MEKPLFMLLSAGLPDRMLRIRLSFKAECVSEMSCYAAERLLFKLYSCSDILLDFRSSRSSFFRSDYSFFSIFFRIFRRAILSSAIEFFELLLHCQVIIIICLIYILIFVILSSLKKFPR